MSSPNPSPDAEAAPDPAPRFYTDPDDDRDILDTQRPGWRLLFAKGTENSLLTHMLNEGIISPDMFFWLDDEGRLIAP